MAKRFRKALELVSRIRLVVQKASHFDPLRSRGYSRRSHLLLTCLAVLLELAFLEMPLHATKLVTYYFRGENRLGAWTESGVIDLNRAYREMLKEKGTARAEDLAL